MRTDHVEIGKTYRVSGRRAAWFTVSGAERRKMNPLARTTVVTFTGTLTEREGGEVVERDWATCAERLEGPDADDEYDWRAKLEREARHARALKDFDAAIAEKFGLRTADINWKISTAEALEALTKVVNRQRPWKGLSAQEAEG